MILQQNQIKLNPSPPPTQKKTPLASQLRPNSPISSRPHNLLQGQSLPLIERGECGLSSQGSVEGRGLKTGSTSVSPKRATEQKGLG